MNKIALLFLPLFVGIHTQGQDMKYMKRSVNTLASNGFGGRGYVGDGKQRAERFIARNYKEIGLQSFEQAPEYLQEYSFDVNTFPANDLLQLGKKQLIPGNHYLIDAASSAYNSKGEQKLKKINLLKVKDSVGWQKMQASFIPQHMYLLQHFDTLMRRTQRSARHIVQGLPDACFVIPQTQKLTWTVATDTVPATVFYVADTAMPKAKKANVSWSQKLVKSQNKNIIGYLPGTHFPDSFIVFTAHYDHLGKMGRKAIFPGANDNASGTAFMLALAKFFAANPPKYSIAFIAFSGEEAGLLGSRHYTQHPVFPLAAIKQLINIDLMGDATDGITMVNAVAQPAVYNSFVAINTDMQYLPKVNSRDNAANSDHYPFTQQAVPAIFIYAMGGPGYYHDVYDKPQEISFRNIAKVFSLITDYIGQL